MSDAHDYVSVFDTTLRDGEQSPNVALSTSEKLAVAEASAQLGVDVIEAGFPAASAGDARAVEAVAGEIGSELSPAHRRDRPPIICGLARAKRSDIDTCVKALALAARPRVHTFLATSPIHREHKLGMSKAEVVEQVKRMVAYAREGCDDVEFSAEDATRTEPEFLFQVLEAAINSGASTVNIPDTVGYTVPDEFYEFIKDIKDNVNGIDDVTLSVHCHDDLGMAAANTLAAIRAGARQVELTVNGIGERAGNAALEEVVMALHVRRDRTKVRTGIDTTKIIEASKLVSQVTEMVVAPNKAVVGDNAFSHEAGIHQDGMLKCRATYEVMRPETVGVGQSKLVLGKHSGRHAFAARLSSLGYCLEPPELHAAFTKFKTLADRKSQFSDEELIALAEGAARPKLRVGTGQ